MLNRVSSYDAADPLNERHAFGASSRAMREHSWVAIDEEHGVVVIEGVNGIPAKAEIKVPPGVYSTFEATSPVCS